MIYGIIIIVLYEMSRVLFKQSFDKLHINNIITRGLCTFQVLFIIILFAVMKSVVTLLDSSFCQPEMHDCKK